MFDQLVTRQQYGNTNLRDTDIFSDLPIQDNSLYHIYYNDFDDYVATNWTITKVGAGTQALVSGDGGILQNVTTSGASDSICTQKLFPSFTTQAGFRLWGRYLFSVDSLLPNMIIGKTNTTTTPFTGGQITDGVWLSTVSGGAISINLAAGGNVKTLATGVSMVAGLTNYCRFSWYWDGGNYGTTPGRVVVQVDGAGVTAPFRGEFGPSAATTLPNTYPSAVATTLQFCIQNTTGVARTQNIDMITLMKERVNILATPAI
jgi:hypothetical protein